MVDTVRGVLRVRKWPKKRGTPKSELQRWWIDWFRQANLLAKYADGMAMARAIQMTKGSGLYPRDIILKAMRGRLYIWADQDGNKWYPMAGIQDISDSLDVLAQQVGSVLVRAVDRWRTPAPATIGNVLTYQGADAAPDWQPAGGAGGFQGGALIAKTANQSIANATWSPLTFQSESYDTANLHDNAVNPSRFTIPEDWAFVQLTGGLAWGSNSTGARLIRFLKNGISVPGMPMQYKRAYATSQASLGSPVLPCVEGDYFEFTVFHNKGSALDVIGPSDNTFFAIEKKG